MTDTTNTPIVDETSTNQQGEDSDLESQEWNLERGMLTIRKLRQEAKDYKKQLQELSVLKSEKQQRDEASMSEQEKVQKQLTELQSQLEQERKDKADRFLEYAIERQATKLGLVDPEAARLLLDKSQLEFDKEGKPSNVEGVLRDLVKTRPYLAGQSANGQQQQLQTMNPTNPSRAGNQQQEKPVYTRAQFTDYKYYQANRDAMMLAMKEGRVVDG